MSAEAPPERNGTSDEGASALLRQAQAGDRRALARLISCAERGERLPPIPLSTGCEDSRLCIGITGAPGAGKSTLVSALMDELLQRADSAAVLAVDPSSPISRGALLGDRLRMHRHAASPQVFIRSMATRSHQGGLASATQIARRLLQHCAWPLVLIETVGVGQVELDVVHTADIALVVLNPGWGDEIQANKAGLMEIADLFVINKADRPGVESTRRDIEAVVAGRPAAQRPAIVETVASEGQGIGELARAIWQTRARLLDSGEMARRAREQLRLELSQRLRKRFDTLLGDKDNPAFEAQISALLRGERDMEAAAAALLPELLAQLRAGL